jgi:dienelactone hydrolase
MNEVGLPREVQIQIGRVTLEGTLTVPENASAIVIFAHGSGSSRLSSRNRHVAKMLNDAGFATLLFDLLTKREEAEDLVGAHLRFDIDFLARRLVTATAWVIQNDSTKLLRIGYFGASTGAAAALAASLELPRSVGALVSRGGRPDMVMKNLPAVEAPTLLIVGANDGAVIEMNKSALNQLRCSKHMEIVPGASHLFEEPGALDVVARLAISWFKKHLVWGTTEQASTAS